MTLFGWALVFVGLALASAAVLVLVGLRLWRGFKALGRDLSRAGDLVAHIGMPGDRTERY